MQAYQVDPSSGCKLIGGDMLEWSDLGTQRPSSALTFVLGQLTRQRRPASVLLLGPAAARLLGAVPGDIPTDVLVRGLPDARALAGRGGSRQQYTVYCGDLGRFPVERTYDLVVALDGPEVLLTPDAQGMTYAQTIERVGRLTADSGRAVIGLANDLGMDALFRLDTRGRLDGDDAWYRGAPGFDRRAPYAREVAPMVQGAGLQLAQQYSVFPSREQQNLLVASTAVTDESVRGGVESMIALSEGGHFASQPALVDPYAFSRRVMDSGMGGELAPMWLLVTGKGEAASVELPGVVSGDDGMLPQWTAITTLTSGEGSWKRTAFPVGGQRWMSERRISRDLDDLSEALPDGDLLESRLRAACAGGNLGEIRTLARRYTAWMREDSIWSGDAGRRRFFASPRNVLLTDAGTELVDASWSYSADLPADESIVRGLREFALRMLRSGAEHPWRPDISADELTETLAIMAGVEWSPELTARIAAREAELTVVTEGGSAVEESSFTAANMELTSSPLTATPGPSRGYRETVATSGRMTTELYERDGQVQWLEATLRQRDMRVGELEHTVGAVKDSVSFKIGRGVTYPGRAAMGAGRRAAMSFLPPNFVPKAQRAMKRLLK